MNRFKFRFTCITLILLLATFFSSGLNIFNTKSMWAAPRSEGPERFIQFIRPHLFNDGPRLALPPNGSTGCLVTKPEFSWMQLEDTTKYKFVLATDPAITEIIDEAQVGGCNYWYDGTLNYNKDYFWHVMAVEPEPSAWADTWSFRTRVAPPEVKYSTPYVLMLALILATAGLISWFIVAKRNRTKP